MQAAQGRFDLQAVGDGVPLIHWTLKVRDMLAQIHAQASIGVDVGEIGKVLLGKVNVGWMWKGFRSTSTSPVLWREKW